MGAKGIKEIFAKILDRIHDMEILDSQYNDKCGIELYCQDGEHYIEEIVKILKEVKSQNNGMAYKCIDNKKLDKILEILGA